MEIRALRPGDDRSAFQSGDEALDRFFHRYAGQNQFRHYLGVTYVAVDRARLDSPTPGSSSLSIPRDQRKRECRSIKEEIQELEKVRMMEALEAAEGNQTHAANLIKMPLRTFVSKVKQYGIVARQGR